MTKSELRDALSDLGLNQSEFARMIGIDPRQVRRWVAGDTAVPGPVVVLVKLWLERPELVAVVKQLSGQREPATFHEAA